MSTARERQAHSEAHHTPTTNRVLSTVTAAALAWVLAVLAMSCTYVIVGNVVGDRSCADDSTSGGVRLIGLGFVLLEGIAGAVFAWHVARRWHGYEWAACFVSGVALLVPMGLAALGVALVGVCFR